MNIYAVNINLLVLFDAIMQAGTVTGAAHMVGITQSGASNGLAQLREIFEDPLFERVGHRMRPTHLALQVSEDVRLGVDALQRALTPGDFDPGALRRELVVCMPDYVQFTLLPQVLAEVRASAPNARVRVITDARQALPSGLATGEVDLFVGFVGSVADEFEAEPLYDDDFVCLLRRQHDALDAEGGLSLEGWLDAGHVVVSSERAGPTLVDRALSDIGRERQIVLRLDNNALLPGVVAQTDLIAAVGRRWAAAYEASDELAVVECPVSLASSRVRMVWHRRAEFDPASTWLREVVARAARA